jgi:hypothetical protein
MQEIPLFQYDYYINEKFRQMFIKGGRQDERTV